jgi:hypothetical protein
MWFRVWPTDFQLSSFAVHATRELRGNRLLAEKMMDLEHLPAVLSLIEVSGPRSNRHNTLEQEALYPHLAKIQAFKYVLVYILRWG